jgi:SulP family sulfate permease
VGQSVPSRPGQTILQSRDLIPSLTAGSILGVIGVLTYLTPMAVLVFSGDLEPHLATGISMTLLSAAVVGIVVALKGSFVGTIALPVPEEMAILGTMGAMIAGRMGDSATPEEVLLTVVAAIALTSLLTGLFAFTLGQLQWGDLIRFLPYPVIGGFLAGLGCLLSQGALKVMTGMDIRGSTLAAFFQMDMAVRWVPGALFAILLLAISRRFSHFLIMPASFLAATGLFYLVWMAGGHPLAEASSRGWLLGPFPQSEIWRPLSLQALAQANWTLVFQQFGSMISVMLITVLSLLMVSSGLELATERELDLNQELRATGMGCFLSGLLGGMVGSHAVTTVLVHKMGTRSRLVGIFAALLYLLVLAAGISIISFFPKPVLGGLLLFLGFDLLTQWVYEAWPKLPRLDYAIVLLIMAIIATVGFVEGVVVGLVVAIIKFVLSYSQVDVAKHTLSGANFTSHVQRSLTQSRLLRQQGDHIYILQLQGLIFFGTAHKLLNQIRSRLVDQNLPELQFILLDFRLVNGLDSSAVVSFVKLKQLIEKEHIFLLLTHLQPDVERRLQQGGALAHEASEYCKQFRDLDQGMAWCEDYLLNQNQFRRPRNLPIAMRLSMMFEDIPGASEHLPHMLDILEACRYDSEAQVFNKGDSPQYLLFIESGQVTTWLEGVSGSAHRLQTLGAGTWLGEVEFFTRTPYKVTAVADQVTVIYRLSRDAIEALQINHPRAANVLQSFLNTLMAERLAQTTQEIEMLMQ